VEGVGQEAIYHTPFAILGASNGDIYIADSYNSIVRKLTYNCTGCENTNTTAGAIAVAIKPKTTKAAATPIATITVSEGYSNHIMSGLLVLLISMLV
jgi:hypothetical protein